MNSILINYKSNDLIKISIAYIAATIEEKIEENGRFECGDCYVIFSFNEKITDAFALKSNRRPCQSTFDVCEIAHKYVRNLSIDFNYTYEKAESDILREFDSATAYSNTNFEGNEPHRDFFISFIVKQYINIQATYVARRVTLKEQKMYRNRYRKLVHFAHS